MWVNSEKTKAPKSGTDCSDWRYGNCVPSNGDCGGGFREGSSDCKYRFETWGECDPNSGLRARTGTLKKALYNAECQQTISVTKPCAGKTKTKTK
ncbi:hypothetical protein CRUP_014162, partial [Coryphaenoides rupestris]